MSKIINVGRVTSYADAVAGGYTGTREEWERDLANLGTTAAEVEANRQAVADDKAAVEENLTTVESYKNSAAQSAAEALQSAENAHTDALAATAAKEAAQTAQGIAEEARADAVSAKGAAESAQTDANASASTATEAALAAGNAATTATAQAGAASDSATAAAASAASVSGVVQEVTQAKTEAISAIETKGAEMLDSIPEDYSELTGDVADLKSAITQPINDSIDGVFVIPQSYIEQGAYNSHGEPINDPVNQTRVRTKIPTYVKAGSSFTFEPGTNAEVIYWFFFKNSGELETSGRWVTTAAKVFSEDGYLHFAFRRLSEQPLSPSEYDAVVDIKTSIANTITALNNGGKELYLGEYVQGQITASGIRTTSGVAGKRLAQKNVVTLPIKIKKLTVHITAGYVMWFRFGNRAENLSNASVMLGPEAECVVPDDAIFYRSTIGKGNITQDYAGDNIDPSEISIANPVVTYVDESNIELNSNDILGNAMVTVSGDMKSISVNATIAHISDVHGDIERVRHFYRFCDSHDIDIACVSGDIVCFDPSQNITWFHDILKDYQTKTAFCLGNHELHSSTYSDSETYTKYYADVAEDIGNTTGESWYYYDVANKSLRVIVLNVYQYGGTIRDYTHFTNGQLSWFCSTLLSTPANYGVVVMYHTPDVSIESAGDSDYPMFFQSDRFSANYRNAVTGRPISDIVDAFISGTTISQTYSQTGDPSSVTVSADFSGKNTGVEFIAHITGHLHQDSICYLPETTNRQLMLNIILGNGWYSDNGYLSNLCDQGKLLGDQSGDTFNVYVIDRANKTVKVVRIGNNLTYEMKKRDYMAIPYADGT